MKNYVIVIDGAIGRPQREITEAEYECFYDEFIDLVEKYNFGFGGTMYHTSEEKYLKEFEESKNPDSSA